MVAPALQFGDEKVQVAGIELVGALGRCACMEEHEMSLQPLALLLGQNGLVDIVRRAVVLHRGDGVIGIAGGTACEVDQNEPHLAGPLGDVGILVLIGRHEIRRIAYGDAVGSKRLIAQSDV